MVHQYKLNGYNIVLDTASGSVHMVDEVAYDIIESFKNKSEDDVNLTERITLRTRQMPWHRKDIQWPGASRMCGEKRWKISTD